MDFLTHVLDGLCVLLLMSLLHDISQQLICLHFAEPCHEQPLFSLGVLIPALRDDSSSERVRLYLIVVAGHLPLHLLLSSSGLIFIVELL